MISTLTKKLAREVTVVVLIVLGVILPYRCCSPEYNRLPKEYIVSVFDAAQIGDGYDNIIDLLTKASVHHIQIEFVSWGNRFIIVRTPLAFSARNWVLYLEFKDSKIFAKYIRYHDSCHAKPITAPDDVVQEKDYVHQDLIPEYVH